MRRSWAMAALSGFLVLAAAGASCAPLEPPPVAPVAPVTSASASVVAAVAPAAPTALPPPTPCEILGREQRAALRPFLDEFRRAFGSFDGRDFVRGFCWPDARGAWGLGFASLVVTPSKLIRVPYRTEAQPEFQVQMTLVRLGLDGSRASSPSRELTPNKQVDGTAFDWSGDGVPELAFPSQDVYSSSELAIWTAQGGKVIPYEPAAGIRARAVEDGDGDGRPDLFYTEPFSAQIMIFEDVDTSQYASVKQGGFWLMAHALADGGFSRDDEVARAYAKSECPDGVLSPPGGTGPEEYVIPLAQTVRCARLWGVERRVIERYLDRVCRKARSCLNEKVLRKWAGASVPFVLK